ncbi:MAG: hypothetical protein FWE67_15980 [Planctomycetaceae bacterium]|nr:hypothetical protein [Planctomycetaceae bacterium]
MAFLRRITNGKGHVEREYVLGRRRTDLAIEFGDSWNIIEIKLLRDKQSFEKVKADGLKQETSQEVVYGTFDTAVEHYHLSEKSSAEAHTGTFPHFSPVRIPFPAEIW